MSDEFETVNITVSAPSELKSFIGVIVMVMREEPEGTFILPLEEESEEGVAPASRETE